jgi:hypothetical protein
MSQRMSRERKNLCSASFFSILTERFFLLHNNESIASQYGMIVHQHLFVLEE